MSTDINTLKTQLVAAKIQLATTTDGKTFDVLTKQIGELQKAISLGENQARQEAADKAAAERAAAVADYEADLAALAKLKADVVKDDEHLFADLADLHEEFEIRYRAGLQVVELENELQVAARNLGLPEVLPEPFTICGILVSQLRKEDVLPAIFNQYNLATGQIADAKKNGQPGVPDRPALDWFAKGDGRYWPRPAEPAPAPNQPEAPAEQPERKGKTVKIPAYPGE